MGVGYPSFGGDAFLALIGSIGAAIIECTAGMLDGGIGDKAGDGGQLGAAVADLGQGVEQTFGVGMHGGLEEVLKGTTLYDTPAYITATSSQI